MTNGLHTRSALVRHAERGLGIKGRPRDARGCCGSDDDGRDDLIEDVIGWSCVAGVAGLALAIFMGWL